ncbi:hypothetical protein FOXG_12505 [Fusarium oxysporum f. sp. lycopersici 4287]|uniref:DUF8032 domain-containing protein n=1 Tax=Fusarium oxysporum f. sp. lycopersici (strain 4287 / CBS 123668 / FGSC 9935 / NRRL 34936) TaxID=426428 RepID=A0A0J9VT76_FUSO4|nr:hypothetical protein FOXG_12505 [Fusarium oxysporum f. sp. lycopersici 4287]EWZ79266.1 hypothetical protein FOWG_16552 [Fusarium oxysporum f. sp. lycopersici MN25]KAJ9413082.1 hypothetical protein QL093DRAFT_2527477 [Fusarium oxysporum]KNB13850.1 hypothetical protein FOXG_12505 [Fusarium oxysporum f. sp. lycopersici 4287]
MATAGDISAVPVEGEQRPFSGEAGCDSWTSFYYSDDDGNKTKDNYLKAMEIKMKSSNLKGQHRQLEASRSRLAEELAEVEAELARIGKERDKAAMQLERIEQDDTGPVSEEILLIEERPASIDVRSQPLLGEKERRTRAQPPIGTYTADRGTLNTLVLFILMKANPTEANSLDIDLQPLPTPSVSQSACYVGKAKIQFHLCKYEPRGDPRWFRGSMAKHMKLKHSDKPPKVFRCDYPGCGKEYRNRQDNLHQHQRRHGHFTNGKDENGELQSPENETPALNLRTAPGPIPATTPLVFRQDSNGVQWIKFEYSRDRVKMEYDIRCDIESVNTDELSPRFKERNCVYPRAYCPKEQYRGKRLMYETECNRIAWALAELNDSLQGKRGLIQRAVDSWRNSNQDPRVQSRRVRRLAKK